MIWNIGLYTLAVFFIAAGINHFRVPGFYLPMMPPYIPLHRLAVFVSGECEILLGALLLWPPGRSLAAWGIVLLLIAVMPVHIYMFQERNGKFARLPFPLLIARIPAQGLLIWWAWVYTRS